MSYTVLARRYRSSTFDEVVGQNHVAQTLKKAIESGRIAHAYLFCGTRGVGKTSMARIMAKALNCEKASGPTTKPCLECSSCQGIARGEDIDVIEIDAASNTGVDNIRELIENSQYRPARARHKIYIIDEVHMLSKSAFNALLKTLEEPPPHVKFILATTEPEKVLPTILSRCQRYDFRNIPTREIAEHLRAVCQDEKIKADEDALMLVAKAGAGSMRDALSLLERLLSIGEKHLTAQTIEQLLGLPRSQALLELAQAIGEGKVKEVLTQADRMISEGQSPDGLIASLIDHFRTLLVLRTCGAESNLVEVAGVALADLGKQAERFDAVVLTQDITILEDLRRQLRQSQAGRALLDATLVRLALAEQFASIEDLLQRVNGGGASMTGAAASAAQKKKFEQPLEAGPGLRAPGAGTGALEPPMSPSAPAEQVESTPTASDDDDDLPRPGKVWGSGSGPSLSTLLAQHKAASAPSVPETRSPDPEPGTRSPEPANIQPVDPNDLPTVWQNLLALLQQRSISLHSLVSPGQLVGIIEQQAVIRYDAGQDTFPKMLARNGKKEQLCDALATVLGKSIGVRFEVDESGSGAAAAPPAAVPSTAAAPAPSAQPTASRAAPALAPAVAAAPAPAAAPSRLTPDQRQELEKDPLIRALMTDLDATLLKYADD